MMDISYLKTFLLRYGRQPLIHESAKGQVNLEIDLTLNGYMIFLHLRIFFVVFVRITW